MSRVPMDIPFDELRAWFYGKPAAILGGGPSLPNDLKRLPDDCILISVNNHAFHYCQPDVLVYQDRLQQPWAADVETIVRTFDGLVISPFEPSDIDLPRDWWNANQSHSLATWFASWMGCTPVILCGMDCYQGDVKYCHPRDEFYHPIFDAPLEEHLNRWKEAFNKCPQPENIRAASGPLMDVFGTFETINTKRSLL